MSKYTVSVYDLERTNFDFGLDDYPIFDEEYRPILNGAILDYYRFKEIGFQNPWQWRDRLRARMNLIMRNKYNDMYLAKMREFNPFYNVEMTETFTRELTGKDSGTNINILTANSKNTGKNVVKSKTIGSDVGSETSNTLGIGSQFPNSEMTENELGNNLFVDTANRTKASGSSTSNSTSDNDTTDEMESRTDNTSDIINTTENDNKQMETYTRKTEGSSAGLSFSIAMQQFKTYLEKYAIEVEIIDELQDLFMSIW